MAAAVVFQKAAAAAAAAATSIASTITHLSLAGLLAIDLPLSAPALFWPASDNENKLSPSS